MMVRNPQKTSFAVALVGAMALAPSAHAGKTARVHLQVPVNTNAPAKTDLDDIETYGKKAFWSHDFSIPYITAQKEIQKALEDTLAQEIGASGTKTLIECTHPCPDVTWWVNYKPTFEFTKKNQPTLTKIGPSSNNRIKVELSTRAKVRIKGSFHADTYIPVPTPVAGVFAKDHEHIEVPFDLFVEVELTGETKATLWPTLAVDDLVIDGKLTSVSANLELNGQGAKLGAKIGTYLGVTPLGLALGGPLTFAPLGALIGDKASKKAEAQMEKTAKDMITEGFNDALAEANEVVRARLKPLVVQANQRKDAVLQTDLPGVGRSIQELTDELGGTMEVHTVTPNGGIAVSGVLRMANNPGQSRVTGVARVTAQRCVYGSLLGTKFPLREEPVNVSLDKKVGQSCSTAFSGVKLVRQGYRGADPRTALGTSADKRKSWTGDLGNASFTGTLEKHERYYECGFEAEGLPNTAILSMNIAPSSGSTIKAAHEPERVMVRRALSNTLVLDHSLAPTTSVTLGGGYRCEAPDNNGMRLVPNKRKELIDLIDNCPECFDKIYRGDELILEFKQGKLAKTPIGRYVLDKAKAAGKRGVKAGAAKHRASTVAPSRKLGTKAKVQVVPGVRGRGR